MVLHREIGLFESLMECNKITIASLNVRGIRDFKKRKSIFNYLYKNKVDVVLLQETHVDKDIITQIATERQGKSIHNMGTSQTAGVAIMVRDKILINENNIYRDSEGRTIICECKINEDKYILTNVYAPNNDNPEYFLKTIEAIEAFVDYDHVFMGGDFNLVMNPSKDRHNSTNNHNKALNVIQEYLDLKNLCDVWRIRNPDTKRYTWHRPVTKSASRIDMILALQGILDKIESCNIIPGIRTDHLMVTVTVKIGMTTRGPGFWKFNNLLLNDTTYVKGVKNVIEETIQNLPLSDTTDIWTMIKAKCVQYSKMYAINCAKNLKNEINGLINTRENLLVELYQNIEVVDEGLIKCSLEDIDKEILRHDIRKTSESIFRSKCNWIKNGETSSKYFFSLEKSNYANKNMKSVILESGEVSYDQNIILEETNKYYQKLYTTNPNTKFNIMRQPYHPVLDIIAKHRCDHELLMDEIYDAIMTLKINKVGRPDGLTVEFFRIFYNELKKTVIQDVHQSIQRWNSTPFHKERNNFTYSKKGQRH